MADLLKHIDGLQFALAGSDSLYGPYYEADPLVCPKYQGPMKIIAFIEELDVIEKILRHLDLWNINYHDLLQKISDYILERVCV
ncbi:MAG: hypothetical protein ABIJ31_14140 [Pseudomonadota bacterium]